MYIYIYIYNYLACASLEQNSSTCARRGPVFEMKKTTKLFHFPAGFHLL